MLSLDVGNNEVNPDIIDNVSYKPYDAIYLFDNMLHPSPWVTEFSRD